MSEIRVLPVLPLRDIVVFPHMVVPLFVGREKSVKALEEVMRGDKQILLATQRNSTDDDPQPGAIYDVGVVATVLQLLKLQTIAAANVVSSDCGHDFVIGWRSIVEKSQRGGCWHRCSNNRVGVVIVGVDAVAIVVTGGSSFTVERKRKKLINAFVN